MTFIMDIVWMTAFILCGRNLWVVILAHSEGHTSIALPSVWERRITGTGIVTS